MKIAMLEPLGVEKSDVLKSAKPLLDQGHELIYCDGKLEEKEVLSRASEADVLIIANSPLKGEVIRQAKNLKMISVAFTGIDHVDVAACKEKKVMVCNAQGYSTTAVSELTIGLILSVLRKIVPCNEVTRQEKTKNGLVGTELYGKTLGVVGTGAIGRRVGQLAKAFGCELLGFSASENSEALKIGFHYVDLNTLMAQSDIVCLHVPLTDKTKGMINKENLSQMKPTGILINVARGPVVNSHDLADALNEGKIAGAGIDVYENEPPIPKDHPLVTAKNTVLTPHVAFATKESMVTRCEITFQNIISWMNGKPINVKL